MEEFKKVSDKCSNNIYVQNNVRWDSNYAKLSTRFQRRRELRSFKFALASKKQLAQAGDSIIYKGLRLSPDKEQKLDSLGVGSERQFGHSVIR